MGTYLTSYKEIYIKLRDIPSLKINSPQTVRNICDRAIDKLKNSLDEKKKQELLSFLAFLNDLSEGDMSSMSASKTDMIY